MGEFFYEGKDLRVRLKLQSHSPKLVVTFTGRAAKPPVAQGFGESFLEKRGISAIHFISTWNHWWQTREVAEVLQRLRAEGVLGTGLPIVMYGSSMGAYAALRYSGDFGATAVLAVSPQYSIDGKVVPFEKRWRDYASKIQFDFDDMPSGLSRDCPVLAVVDPFFLPDWKHVELVLAIRPIEILPAAFAGHNTARALEEVGMVSDVMHKALLGQLDRKEFIREFRRRRRSASLVWLGLAEKLQARGRPGGTTVAATLAAALLSQGARMGDRPLRTRIFELALESACADGYEALAREWLRNLKEMAPESALTARCSAQVALAFGDGSLESHATLLAAHTDVDSLLLRAQLLERMGRASDAGELLRHVPAKFAKSPQLHIASAEAHLRAGDTAKALEAARGALKYGPQRPEARLLLARALLAAGNENSARAALSPVLGWTVTSNELAESIASVAQSLFGKAPATAFRARTRRARWIQSLVIEQLEHRGPGAHQVWIDQTCRVVREKLAARRRRLEASVSEIMSQQPVHGANS